MNENWLERWHAGRTGWHEPEGNAGLRSLWPELAEGSRVLVPLCGKSVDLLWLAERSLDVVGVELSQVAVEGFFADHALAFEIEQDGPLTAYRASDLPITICQGDFFAFDTTGFDALYDRGALGALDAETRPAYAAHTGSLLKPDAAKLIVTLEYDQQIASGPPYSVVREEIIRYWPDVERVADHDDMPNCPPKFLDAGLKALREVYWRSK